MSIDESAQTSREGTEKPLTHSEAQKKALPTTKVDVLS